jgi:uncharacterized membrane protein
LTVGAVVGAAIEVEVKGLVDAIVGLVVEDGVRTGNDARGTPRAQTRGHYFTKELSPLRFFDGHG